VPLSNFVPRGFGFVHHSIAFLYHQVPNPNLTIRNFCIAVRRAGPLRRRSCCARVVRWRARRAPPRARACWPARTRTPCRRRRPCTCCTRCARRSAAAGGLTVMPTSRVREPRCVASRASRREVGQRGGRGIGRGGKSGEGRRATPSSGDEMREGEQLLARDVATGSIPPALSTLTPLHPASSSPHPTHSPRPSSSSSGARRGPRARE
jgi:hypothetical protein